MTAEQSKADQAREKILINAIQEFALQGYNKASTNRIMEEAGMAKGLLFHYFSNKPKLYLACLDKVLSEFQVQLDQFMQHMSQDIFERLASYLRWKSELFHSKPITFRFLLGINKLPPEVRQRADSALAAWRKKNSQLLADYDAALWDPGVNQRDALEIVVLLFDSLDNRWMQEMDAGAFQDREKMLNHALRLLDVLRAGFYLDPDRQK